MHYILAGIDPQAAADSRILRRILSAENPPKKYGYSNNKVEKNIHPNK